MTDIELDGLLKIYPFAKTSGIWGRKKQQEMLEWQKIQANMQGEIETLAILAEDCTDPNGYIRLNGLGNFLRYGAE